MGGEFVRDDQLPGTFPGPALGHLQELHLARVVENEDPAGRGRIQVHLQALEVELWASVVVPSAGSGYGTSFIPRRDEMVVVAFVTPEMPLVLGSIWSGGDSHPESGQAVEDKYAIETPAGTKLILDDSGDPTVEITTPSGYHLKITDADGGKIELSRGGQTLAVDSSSIKITASSEITLEAAQVKVDASMVQVNAGMSRFSGVVQCDTLITNAVVSSSYTPGAGNIW